MQAAVQVLEIPRLSTNSVPGMETGSLFQMVGTQATLLNGRIRQEIEDATLRAEVEKAVGQFACPPSSVLAVEVFDTNLRGVLDEAARLSGAKEWEINLNPESFNVAIVETQGRENETLISQMLRRMAFLQSLLKIAELLVPGLAELLNSQGISSQILAKEIAEVSKLADQARQTMQKIQKNGADAQTRQLLTNQLEALKASVSKLPSVPGLNGIKNAMVHQVKALINQSKQMAIQPQLKADVRMGNSPMPSRVAAVLDKGKKIESSAPRSSHGLKAALDPKAKPATILGRAPVAPAAKAPVSPVAKNAATLASRATATPRVTNSLAARATASLAATQSRATLASRVVNTVRTGVVAATASVVSAIAPVQAAISPTAPVAQAQTNTTQTTTVSLAAPTVQEAPKADTSVTNVAPVTAAPQQAEAPKESVVAVNQAPAQLPSKPEVVGVPPIQQPVVETKPVLPNGDPIKVVGGGDLPPPQQQPALPPEFKPDPPIGGPTVTPQPVDLRPDQPPIQPVADPKPAPEQVAKPEGEKPATSEGDAARDFKAANVETTKQPISDQTPPPAPAERIATAVETFLKANPDSSRIDGLQNFLQTQNQNRPEAGSPEYKSWVETRGATLKEILKEQKEEKKMAAVVERPGCKPGCGGSMGCCPS